MNKQFQKVIDGLTRCNQSGYVDSECTKCPYDKDYFVDYSDMDNVVVDFTDNACFNKLNNDALDLLKEYDAALRMMVYQYCTIAQKNYRGENCENPDKEVFFHAFMSAGENAFKLLGIKNGEEVEDSFIWG